MSTFLPAEKGQTIRMPSTANLMVDSADRNVALNPRANDFQISRPQSILNGFFTRIGTTEVVLEYSSGNISSSFNNNVLTIDLSGGTTGGGTASQTYQAPPGFYTQAELINWALVQLNALSATLTPAVTWTIAATTTGTYALVPAANVYVQFSGNMAVALGWNTGSLLEYGPTGLDGTGFEIPPADLRPFRYLDFVSAQLTYNQDLKDSSTNAIVRDVLCRWYMAWDNPPTVDQYGFPVLMGYEQFVVRRLFSPPKQIRWDNIQPIGNLGFQVYTDQNVLAPFTSSTNWLMTLQVSEC